MNFDLLTRLRKPNLLSRIKRRIIAHFYFEQWTIRIAKKYKNDIPSWPEFRPIIPPPDRDWADPFLWSHNNQYYIFIEEKLYSTNRGQIACLSLDKHMNVIANRTVLQRPYHLSYPFLFEEQGTLFMIPETGENHTIEVYRCTDFPEKWELAQTMLADIQAYDATLHQSNNKWWMFANVTGEDGSSWNTLNLYYADRPITDEWKPHSKNPIIVDIHSARPAGRIFHQNGCIIRPSQDCSIRYGYAINFNKIDNLDEKVYEESLERKLKPPRLGNIIATHTWNELHGMIVIDAKIYRRKAKE